jgi:hypothetical protein
MRSIVLATAVIVAAAALGYYFGRNTSPSSPSLAPVAAEPERTPTATPKRVGTPENEEQQSASATADQVEEFNRNAARTQALLPPSDAIAKKALVGDEVVTVNFKPNETPPRPANDEFIDNNRSPGFFDPLAREAAAGSDSAALQLWQSLQNCEQAPKTQDELRTSLEEAKKRFELSGGANGVFGTTQTYEQAVGIYQTKYDRCQGVKPKMYDEALQYLREAGDRGDSAILAITYAGAIMKSDPEDSQKRYESVWEEGHVAGLVGLGLVQNSTSHLLAFYAAAIAHVDGVPEPNPLPNMFRAKIAELQNQVSPYEFQEATKKAAQLLRSPNCCIDP